MQSRGSWTRVAGLWSPHTCNLVKDLAVITHPRLLSGVWGVGVGVDVIFSHTLLFFQGKWVVLAASVFNLFCRKRC